MTDMRPPDEDIRVFQHLIRQSVLGLVHGGGPHLDIRFLAEQDRQIAMNPFRKQRDHIFIFRLAQIFIPNGNPNHPNPSPIYTFCINNAK